MQKPAGSKGVTLTFIYDYTRTIVTADKTMYALGCTSQPPPNRLNDSPDSCTDEYSQNDDLWLACIFATIHQEADRKIEGIEEYGPDSCFKKHDRRANYFGPEKEDWVNAHEIISRVDKANLTAAYC